MKDAILTEIMMRRGANKAIAEGCNLSTAAVSQWVRVPKRHVEKVSELMKVPPQKLRPDLFCEPTNEGIAA
ncbi:chaperone [Acetobacter orientalis]|uniref:Chaperone n=1 Tax=Acetobacter orientalis TaxID=146474 RepID=A0A2Z5ZE53_9PROT|nr:chaperone [Acetobacter orientalis]